VVNYSGRPHTRHSETLKYGL